jgi:hypothetical protein
MTIGGRLGGRRGVPARVGQSSGWGQTPNRASRLAILIETAKGPALFLLSPIARVLAELSGFPEHHPLPKLFRV